MLKILLVVFFTFSLCSIPIFHSPLCKAQDANRKLKYPLSLSPTISPVRRAVNRAVFAEKFPARDANLSPALPQIASLRSPHASAGRAGSAPLQNRSRFTDQAASNADCGRAEERGGSRAGRCRLTDQP